MNTGLQRVAPDACASPVCRLDRWRPAVGHTAVFNGIDPRKDFARAEFSAVRARRSDHAEVRRSAFGGFTLIELLVLGREPNDEAFLKNIGLGSLPAKTK